MYVCDCLLTRGDLISHSNGSIDGEDDDASGSNVLKMFSVAIRAADQSLSQTAGQL